MGKLVNKTRGNTEIASHVEVARTFFARAKGLLGEPDLPRGRALWILRCNSVHTFFMRFAIDAVFVDQDLVVKAKHESLPPWRMTSLFLNARSVFELPAGTLRERPVEIGDQLYVGD